MRKSSEPSRYSCSHIHKQTSPVTKKPRATKGGIDPSVEASHFEKVGGSVQEPTRIRRMLNGLAAESFDGTESCAADGDQSEC